jgi:hypothetical protein
MDGTTILAEKSADHRRRYAFRRIEIMGVSVGAYFT